MHVAVLGINDNSPQFSQSVFTFQLSTEALRGQFVGHVAALDPDQDTLQYGIVSKRMQHMFTINSNTGGRVLKILRIVKKNVAGVVNSNVS